LIDIDTGRVIEFGGGEHEKLMRQIAASLGFDLVSTRLEIYGRKVQTAPIKGARQAEPGETIHPETHKPGANGAA
jgi:Fur family ferric uptake transcriptional regulator